jgi:hypothetical protein
MSVSRITPARVVPAANEMMFLFADGAAPVARTDVTVVALGKFTNRGRKTDPTSPLLNDIELGKLMTGGVGEFALDDPGLKTGYEHVSDLVKAAQPSLDRWVGVPGQPTPLFPGGVHPSPSSFYPRLPVVVELAETAFRPSPLTFPMKAGKFLTSWQRPPVAHLDRPFAGPAEFVEHLAAQFSRTAVPLPFKLTITRPGSVSSGTALEPVFFALANQLQREPRNPVRSDPLGTELDRTARRVAAAVAGPLGIPATADLRGAYRDTLRRIGRLAGSDPYDLSAGPLGGAGPLEAATIAVCNAFNQWPGPPVIWRPYEDWAALGAAVFLAGAPVLGYRAGVMARGDDWSRWEFRAAMRRP